MEYIPGCKHRYYFGQLLFVSLWGSKEGGGDKEGWGEEVTEINWDVKSFLLLLVKLQSLKRMCTQEREQIWPDSFTVQKMLQWKIIIKKKNASVTASILKTKCKDPGKGDASSSSPTCCCSVPSYLLLQCPLLPFTVGHCFDSSSLLAHLPLGLQIRWVHGFLEK